MFCGVERKSMALAVLYSCALSGMQAPTVCVEVHVSPGLPAFTIVGLPDTSVRESRERVRSALEAMGWDFPIGRFTVNLSPTALPKESGRFDLPIAMGVLMATGQLVLAAELQAHLPALYLMGELSLTGALVPVQAPLIMALSVYKQNPHAIIIMPSEDAKMAAHIRGLNVVGANTLNEVVAYLSGEQTLNYASPSSKEDQAFSTVSQESTLCLSDIRGQSYACKVLEMVASGGHGLLLGGSPGVGKTMLAQRLPTLLPTLNSTDSLEVIALYSLSKVVPPSLGIPPFRAPHHSSSRVALVGGGANASPGEISLANHGVLFLDELPEFERAVLEALREPLEKGEINVARAKRTQTYPARFQLVAAYNPCPCGYLGHTTKHCRCTPDKITRYQHKLSGPLLDRIDVHLHIHPVGENWLQAEQAEPSAVVRERVKACRAIQFKRQSCLNAYLTPSQVTMFCALAEQEQHVLTQAIAKFSWSARVSQKVLKIARTIADMQGHENITSEDVSQAILCRNER